MTDSHYSEGSAAASGLANCHYCNTLTPINQQYCSRCHSPLHLRKKHSIQKTLALLITAIVLYFPANLYPIMSTATLGSPEANTIMEGVITFFAHGSYSVALIIFTASIIVPIAKMLALLWLCYNVMSQRTLHDQELTRLYRIVEFIGKWSMIDVFVVAIMVALVQLGSLMSITPGLAALAFAGVVMLTMIAAHEFDTRLLWDKSSQQQRIQP